MWEETNRRILVSHKNNKFTYCMSCMNKNRVHFTLRICVGINWFPWIMCIEVSCRWRKFLKIFFTYRPRRRVEVFNKYFFPDTTRGLVSVRLAEAENLKWRLSLDEPHWECDELVPYTHLEFFSNVRDFLLSALS